MNLREFTEAVDNRTRNMTAEELQTAFHSLARKVPEENRADVLELMNQVGQTSFSGEGKKKAASMAKAQDEAEIKKEYARLKKQFERIEEEELMLYADGYEDYSSGYWDSDWVYEYEDPDGIGAIYEDAARFVERCITDGFCSIALKIFDLMMNTEVWANDGGDCFSLGLEEMIDEKLVSINVDSLKKNVLYGVYQNTPLQKRPAVFYDYMTQHFFHDVRIEDILSMGREELSDSSDFMEGWIAFLMKNPGDTAGKFLCEAVLYQKSGDEIIETAIKAVKCHPSLLLAAMEHFEERRDTKRQLTMGKEALKRIEKKYVIRSRVALKTAEAAIESHDRVLAAQCLELAFESDTCPVNYLRMIVENHGERDCRERAARMMKEVSVFGQNVYGQETSREWETNGLSSNERAQMLFLTGDFDGAMKLCNSVKEGLGWSGTFVKCGISLFLLLLLKSDTLGKGGRYAAGTAAVHLGFQAKEYVKGTVYGIKSAEKKELEDSDDTDLFWRCFCQWKEGLSLEELTEAQVESYTKILEKLIDLRVKAIVSGQHRNHYGSVAALAAALGEMKESRGEKGAAARVLLGYKEQFPKHSSFHHELRAYGMPDTRKKPRR